VVAAIGSVIGGAKIEASWPDWNTTNTTTTWTCWVVTQKALGYARVEYEKNLYDEHEEHRHALTPSNQSAWVRPLTGVIGLRWGAVSEAEAMQDTYYPADPITVTFTDWETTIPEADFPVDQRRTADRFLTALRRCVNF
jgi:Fe-S-cluster formation regulator IscX/YfhJ